MSKILALETATAACSVALLSNDSVLERFKIVPREHAQLILPMLKSLLAEAEFTLSKLDAIAFGRGPGSFTGVRIAVAITQGLAFGADLPVVPISSLRALAQGTSANKILAAFDARMHEIYWGIYQLDKNNLMQPVIEDSLATPDKVQLPENDNWTGVGDGWQAYENILKQILGKKLSAINAGIYPRARDVAKLGAADYLRNKAVSADKALPIYLRSVL
jgi:tRNA threonylcarbamoyladenosine biosynthesis protein TsaB